MPCVCLLALHGTADKISDATTVYTDYACEDRSSDQCADVVRLAQSGASCHGGLGLSLALEQSSYSACTQRSEPSSKLRSNSSAPQQYLSRHPTFVSQTLASCSTGEDRLFDRSRTDVPTTLWHCSVNARECPQSMSAHAKNGPAFDDVGLVVSAASW
jgi:hypothetical protein